MIGPDDCDHPVALRSSLGDLVGDDLVTVYFVGRPIHSVAPEYQDREERRPEEQRGATKRISCEETIRSSLVAVKGELTRLNLFT
ncbi:hypothetical protein GCM10008995_28320 [Halobellus salinus]|uniref:Uncharacterized protein n=1 Tax=Halobellus salinus TaxID=931585 RepID=A0A830EJ69_9EURY|nr:hypothetical protein GCM10008995_28320 [Halobellus salinus]